jgi:hypothetical protein
VRPQLNGGTLGEPMSKRDLFWESLRAEDGESVAWPSEPEARSQLASKIVGATVVGAAEHVLREALDRLEGLSPDPGSDDYQAKLHDADVLAKLSDEQRAVVARLLRETAYFSLYWPMVKIRSLPGLTLEMSASRGSTDAVPETFRLTEFLDPHQLLIGWIDEFGELLDEG